MRIAAKVMAGALLAGAFAAAPAGAQVVNYSTTGQFVSSFPTCNSGPTLVAVCSGGGFTLTFNGTEPNLVGYQNGSAAFLGSFLLTPTNLGVGSTVDVPNNAVVFTLAINQISPTTGSSSTTGTFTGRVSYTPASATNPASGFSSLVFAPNQVVTIGGTTYRLIFDAGPEVNYNGIKISLDVNQPTSVKAIVNTNVVPEPASVGLLATGLVGLFGISRRRKKVA